MGLMAGKSIVMLKLFIASVIKVLVTDMKVRS